MTRREPPKDTRFKKGQSGNPAGRPKGSRNTATILKNLLDSKVSVVNSGRKQNIPIREVMLRRLAEMGMKGDRLSTVAVFALEKQLLPEALPEINVPLDEEDHAIIRAYQARLDAARGDATSEKQDGGDEEPEPEPEPA